MKTKTLSIIAIFCAITCILSTVSIPSPFGVPLTLQTFAISLCGFFLGKRNCTLCVFIYLLLGAIGLPVFAGFSGGISKLFSASGGFLIGFLFLSFFCGLGIKYSFIGLFICHILGIIQFSFITKTPIISSFIIVSMPYIVKDLISIGFAYLISKKLSSYI